MINEEAVASILAAISERNGAWTFDELFERFGDDTTSGALTDLRDLEPVVWLADPDRVSLTSAAIESIRSG